MKKSAKNWPVSATAAERNRRSVYIAVRRNLRYPMLAMFDARRQADLRAMLGALGQGFAGRGAQLNGAVGQAPLALSLHMPGRAGSMSSSACTSVDLPVRGNA